MNLVCNSGCTDSLTLNTNLKVTVMMVHIIVIRNSNKISVLETVESRLINQRNKVGGRRHFSDTLFIVK